MTAQVSFDFTGTEALITGGTSGIGYATAVLFRDAGAQVAITGTKPAASDYDVDLSGMAYHQLRMTEHDSVDALAQNFARLDVLVNNAGIAGPTAAVEDIAPDDWSRTLAVNITGQFLCARKAVPLLKEAGGGCIINMSSAAGRLGYPLRTPYAASKWAVVGFTESLAMELGPHNIRVNTILPGLVQGERITRVLAARAQAQGLEYEEMERQYLDRVSLRRMVSPADVAAMVSFLCSPAGRNISGQSLGVCGNIEVLR